MKLSSVLNIAAQGHSDDTAERDFFDHVTPGGSTVGERAKRAGHRWRTVLENLSVGQ